MADQSPEPARSQSDQPHEDTDDETRAVRVAILRRLTSEQRVEIALQMSMDVRAIALAGIAERHPGASAREHELELFRILYGHTLIDAAFPNESRLQR